MENNREVQNLCAQRSELEAMAKIGYLIEEKIGKGNYATVRLARYFDDAGRKTTLACKIFDKKTAPTVVLKKFFPRELDIIRRLNHPSIIQIHSILQRGDKIYIFMRHAENGDLLDHINAVGAIPEPQCRIWMHQLINGLQYLHKLNIAHRDLKCENILLTKHLNVKLADFGFAKLCEGRDKMSQTFCGSAIYASPEIIGCVRYNPKIADIWSLGIVLFIIANAIMPFDDTSQTKLLNDQRNRNYHFKQSMVNLLSDEYKELVQQILEPDVKIRLTLKQIEKSNWMNLLTND